MNKYSLDPQLLDCRQKKKPSPDPIVRLSASLKNLKPAESAQQRRLHKRVLPQGSNNKIASSVLVGDHTNIKIRKKAHAREAESSSLKKETTGSGKNLAHKKKMDKSKTKNAPVFNPENIPTTVSI